MKHLRREFGELVQSTDGSLQGGLDRAAMLIAAAVDPSTSVDDELGRLDALAAATEADTPAELAIALFGGAAFDPTRHFRGNQTDYYDLNNSLLNQVLDRRIGIPISLSVLLIEIGRRRHIPLAGVSMPGHFLVRSHAGFIDPYNGGVLIDERGCLEIFRGLAGPSALLPQGALDSVPEAMIVRRMLANIVPIALNRQDRSTLRAARSLVAAFPDATHREHVQHAYAAAEIGQFDEAALAAEQAMLTVPDSVKDKLATQIASWQARLN